MSKRFCVFSFNSFFIHELKIECYSSARTEWLVGCSHKLRIQNRINKFPHSLCAGAQSSTGEVWFRKWYGGAGATPLDQRYTACMAVHNFATGVGTWIFHNNTMCGTLTD
jgi:hypothetical protein